MFKVLILQTMHSLSDERCEYLIKDRLSFMPFLGFGLSDPVPDANTRTTSRKPSTALIHEHEVGASGKVKRGCRLSHCMTFECLWAP